jgi:hypothetical protein
MRITVPAVLAITLALAGCGEGKKAAAPGDGDVLACLPAKGEIEGLKLASPPAKFAGTDLSKHVAGEADVYHSYGFECVATARYANTLSKAGPEKASIQVDVFRMRDPIAAYGAYSYHSYDTEPPVTRLGLGAGALLGASSGHLCKGNCYVKVETPEKSEEAREVMRSVLRCVAKKIAGKSTPPDILDKLPLGMALPGRVRLFTDSGNLGNIHWISDTDIFALVRGVQGVVGETADGENAFVVLYPDDASAAKGWSRYREFLVGSGAAEQGIFMVGKQDDNTYTAAFRKGACVAGAWDARTADRATDLAARIATHITK